MSRIFASVGIPWAAKQTSVTLPAVRGTLKRQVRAPMVEYAIVSMKLKRMDERTASHQSISLLHWAHGTRSFLKCCVNASGTTLTGALQLGQMIQGSTRIVGCIDPS